MPQAWVPRVMFGALGLLLLACLSPLPTRIGDEGWLVRVVATVVALPFAVLAVACLASALRPGSLGRAARRLRGRRAGGG